VLGGRGRPEKAKDFRLRYFYFSNYHKNIKMEFVLILTFICYVVYALTKQTGQKMDRLKKEYEQSLKSGDKSAALESGRIYHSYLRAGSLSIYDEQAIANDLSVMPKISNYQEYEIELQILNYINNSSNGKIEAYGLHAYLRNNYKSRYAIVPDIMKKLLDNKYIESSNGFVSITFSGEAYITQLKNKL
jgi:hypothetical protein